MEEIKRHLITSARRSLEPYIYGEEDTNARLEGELAALNIAATISYEEMPEVMSGIQKAIYEMLLEEEVDTERIEYAQGTLSQLKHIYDGLSRLAAVLNQHAHEDADIA